MPNPQQAEVANDHHRPRYHFLPPRNWINDPNGLIQIRGEYHLFYQHNPQCPWWGPMHWGHARSQDLVHWEPLPIAMSPDQPYDASGVWSGCAIEAGGKVAAFYTGVADGRPQTQCLATSDDLSHWCKHPANPVVGDRPAGVAGGDFRDPCVFRHGDRWLMVVGACIDGHGAALLYASTDMVHWQYLHPLLEGDRKDHDMWECPNFFPLGDRWVLLVSATQNPPTMFYFVGRFENDRLLVERQGVLESGDVWAPQVFGDAAGRRIMFTWVKEARDKEPCLAAGWAGCLSLPRELSLRGGELLVTPAAEVAGLRGRALHHGGLTVGGDQSQPIILQGGDHAETVATIMPGSWVRAGLEALVSPDGKEKTRIYFDKPSRRIVIDREQSSSNEALWKWQIGREIGGMDCQMDLRVFIDGSVIEVYAGGLCLTARAYPQSAGPFSLAALATGEPATFGRCDVWQIGR